MGTLVRVVAAAVVLSTVAGQAQSFSDQERPNVADCVTQAMSFTMNGSSRTDLKTLPASWVTLEFFRRPGAGALVGRLLDERDFRVNARPAAVLTYSLFVELFGQQRNPFVIGRTVAVHGDRFVIVGIAAPDFEPRDAGVIWIPRPPKLKN
jgi:MacB-like periplasmic core domain